MQFKEYERKMSRPILKYYPSTCLDDWGKQQNLSE